MRIISKFKDYYDGLMDHSKDRLNKVWERNEVSVRVSKDKIKDIAQGHFHWGYKLELIYLVVAGKTYPIIVYTDFRNRIGLDEVRTYYYNLEDFDKDHPEETRPLHNTRHAKNGYLKNDIKYWWVDFFKPREDLTNICIEFNTPVLLIRSQYEALEIIKNVNLKNLQFYKIMDAHQVYQELDMFVSNILINDDMPLSPMTDDDKILAHGFDLKVSFRKEKVSKG